ncbi:hypothetical protein HAHE_08820 [Haloferula helveola]|uniref:SHOCT domain-containing protein n=1 Tax=Haloferula helveola TaxID=490095 RepID=A0ABM7RBI1_9BACT|nr:hypothetical protein HAHE_08820 [Haloferula helveola]
MNIASEIEKLTSLRDRGDLSPAEFEQAKALVLSGKDPDAQLPPHPIREESEKIRKKAKTQLLGGILASTAAVLSGCSVLLNPSTLKLVIMTLWVIASVFWWISYFKLRTQRGKLGRS